MKEFKLRAYDTQCECMCLVTRIYKDLYGNINEIGLISCEDLHSGYFDGQYYSTKLKEIIIMQYIGINDINNKPIYEGDILKTKWQHCGITNYNYEIIGEIQYLKEYLSYRMYHSGEIYELHNHHDEKLLSVEVIGNVYENPEILQGSVKNDI